MTAQFCIAVQQDDLTVVLKKAQQTSQILEQNWFHKYTKHPNTSNIDTNLDIPIHHRHTSPGKSEAGVEQEGQAGSRQTSRRSGQYKAI